MQNLRLGSVARVPICANNRPAPPHCSRASAARTWRPALVGTQYLWPLFGDLLDPAPATGTAPQQPALSRLHLTPAPGITQ
ncbi:hypothetical protein GCM10009630_59650 [Kribbella jejuensis]